MRRLVSKKAVTITAVVGLVLGGAGVALAGFVGGDPNSGSASTGFPTSFTVSSPLFTGGPLYPGKGGDNIVATIQNATGTSLPLNQISVSITGVTMNPLGASTPRSQGFLPARLLTTPWWRRPPACGKAVRSTARRRVARR